MSVESYWGFLAFILLWLKSVVFLKSESIVEVGTIISRKEDYHEDSL